MSLIDKAKEKLSEHKDQAKQGVNKGKDTADEKTGGKYSDQINSAEEKAQERLDNLGNNS